MHHAIYEELTRVANVHGLTTYGAIAPLAGLDMQRPRDRGTLARLLCEIDAFEHAQGRPLLAAIVVRKHERLPGPGFFLHAQDLGVAPIDGHGTERAFFAAEIAKVYLAWTAREQHVPGDA